MKLTKKNIYQCLSTVIDPELHVDVVSIGLIYDVTISGTKDKKNASQVHILMTLTTPGCPLIGVLHQLVYDSLSKIDDLDAKKNVEIELTFDPPWVIDMMNEETRAELGFD